MASKIVQVSLQKNMQASVPVRVKTYYVDGSGLIAGRLCSNVAKLLLDGNSVVITNAGNTLLSGARPMVVSEWLERLKIASVVHPRHGPFHPRTPSGMITRMVRGMIPRRKPRGRAALKRLRVYPKVPENLKKVKSETFEDSKATKPLAFYVKLADVASRIGWKGGAE